MEKNISLADIKLLTDKKVIANWGKGFDLKKDRIFIRELLFSILKEPASSLCIKKITFYLPIPILEGGSQIVDIPGFDDDDFHCDLKLRETINKAKGLWCITDKSLDTSKQMCNIIQESGIIERMMIDPIHHFLVICHICERTNNIDMETILKSKNNDNNNEILKSRKKLDLMISNLSKNLAPNFS